MYNYTISEIISKRCLLWPQNVGWHRNTTEVWLTPSKQKESKVLNGKQIFWLFYPWWKRVRTRNLRILTKKRETVRLKGTKAKNVFIYTCYLCSDVVHCMHPTIDFINIKQASIRLSILKIKNAQTFVYLVNQFSYSSTWAPTFYDPHTVPFAPTFSSTRRKLVHMKSKSNVVIPEHLSYWLLLFTPRAFGKCSSSAPQTSPNKTKTTTKDLYCKYYRLFSGESS